MFCFFIHSLFTVSLHWPIRDDSSPMIPLKRDRHLFSLLVVLRFFRLLLPCARARPLQVRLVLLLVRLDEIMLERGVLYCVEPRVFCGFQLCEGFFLPSFFIFALRPFLLSSAFRFHVGVLLLARLGASPRISALLMLAHCMACCRFSIAASSLSRSSASILRVRSSPSLRLSAISVSFPRSASLCARLSLAVVRVILCTFLGSAASPCECIRRVRAIRFRAGLCSLAPEPTYAGTRHG